MGIVLQVANLKDVYLLEMDNGNHVHPAKSSDWSVASKDLEKDDNVRMGVVLSYKIITYITSVTYS